MSFILLVLLGVLGIFLLVRIVKYASRTVDEEQRNKQRPLSTSVPNGQPQPEPGPEAPIIKPKEVRLGMTPEGVESALGSPQTKADLGEKILYKYEGMTVEFKAGKVADVR